MEQNDTNIFEQNGLDDVAKAHLLETTRWTKFLAIMGFISSAFIIFAGFTIIYSTSVESIALAGLGSGLGLTYILLAAVYIYPSVCLIKFSKAIKLGIHTNNSELISDGFRHQKNMYRFIGIFLIITIVLMLIMIIYGISGKMMSAM